ncbi:hypothetical protein K525DRAFT_274999 [Schizophyllum commune Loenen D]|nr:hypothetical protein K525DRAFT_274999 [Schizophyllum commune Loenen D]
MPSCTTVTFFTAVDPPTRQDDIFKWELVPDLTTTVNMRVLCTNTLKRAYRFTHRVDQGRMHMQVLLSPLFLCPLLILFCSSSRFYQHVYYMHNIRLTSSGIQGCSLTYQSGSVPFTDANLWDGSWQSDSKPELQCLIIFAAQPPSLDIDLLPNPVGTLGLYKTAYEASKYSLCMARYQHLAIHAKYQLAKVKAAENDQHCGK